MDTGFRTPPRSACCTTVVDVKNGCQERKWKCTFFGLIATPKSIIDCAAASCNLKRRNLKIDIYSASAACLRACLCSPPLCRSRRTHTHIYTGELDQAAFERLMRHQLQLYVMRTLAASIERLQAFHTRDTLLRNKQPASSRHF